MQIDVIEIKKFPKKEIEVFQDRTIYNCATITRETTKANNSFPYLTGKLMRSEVALPISGKNKEYSLLTGVDYAKRVWGYKNAHWTNPQTKPQWYQTIFELQKNVILTAATIQAKKEL
jgi:hypothetical protein